jgi:hypothetical protein
VLSANASGAYAKRFVKPAYRFSDELVFTRKNLSSMGALWRALSSTQRDDWATYAADPAQEKTDSLGHAYYLNGYQWFVSCNSQLIFLSLPDIQDAPVNAIPAMPTLNTLTITAPGTSSCEIDFDDASFGSDYAVFFLTLASGDSRLSVNRRNFRFANYCLPSMDPSPLDLGSIDALFGTVTAGQYWTCQGYRMNDEGRRSAAAYVSTVAV